MASKISEKDVKDFASTKHKGLPNKVKKKKDKKMKESRYKTFGQYLAELTTAQGEPPQYQAGVSGNVSRRQDYATDAAETLPYMKKIKSIVRYMIGMNLDDDKFNKVLQRIKLEYTNWMKQKQAQQQAQTPPG